MGNLSCFLLTKVIKETWMLIVWSAEKLLKILIQKCLEHKIKDQLWNQNVVIVELKNQDL